MSTHARHGLEREEIIENLRKEGLNTLDDLVDRMLKEPPSLARLLTPATPISRKGLPPRVKGSKELVRRRPEIPFFVDGVQHDPADIKRYDGQSLDFLATNNPKGTGQVLNAFTGSVLQDYFNQSFLLNILGGLNILSGGAGVTPADPSGGPGGGSFPDGGGGVVSAPNTLPNFQSLTSVMFSDKNYGGDSLSLPAGYEYSDLATVGRYPIVLWWYTQTWNDCISSMWATDTFVAYYSDWNYTGDCLMVAPFVPTSWIGSLWNDQISSVINYS